MRRFKTVTTRNFCPTCGCLRKFRTIPAPRKRGIVQKCKVCGEKQTKGVR